MDKSTHEIRLTQWKQIIEQCQRRPEGQSAKQWLEENQINDKSYYYWQTKIRRDICEQMERGTSLPSTPTQKPSTVSFAEISFDNRSAEAYPASFQPAAVIKTARATVALSEQISDRLLDRILQEVAHA